MKTQTKRISSFFLKIKGVSKECECTNSCQCISLKPVDILRTLKLRVNASISIKATSLLRDNNFACTLFFHIADNWKVMINWHVERLAVVLSKF